MPHDKKLIFASVIFAALSVAGGLLAFDTESIASNLVSEAVGLALGVPVTFYIVEKILSNERRRKLTVVSTIARKLLWRHAYDISGWYCVRFHHLNQFSQHFAYEIDHETFLTSLREVIAAARAHEGEPDDDAAELRKELEWNVRQLLEFHLSRAIDTLEDEPLMNSLVELYEAEGRWHDAQEIYEWDGPGLYASSIGFLDALLKVCVVLDASEPKAKAS